MSDYVEAWRDACTRIGERRFGTMTEERKYTLELTAQEAALVSLVLTHAALATVSPGIRPPDVTFDDILTISKIGHDLNDQVLAKED